MLTELVPGAAVVICTRGSNPALTIRNVLAGGKSAGVRTAAGVAIGQSVWTVAAILDLTTLLRASPPAFLALQPAGVVSLVFLGVRLAAGQR